MARLQKKDMIPAILLAVGSCAPLATVPIASSTHPFTDCGYSVVFSGSPSTVPITTPSRDKQTLEDKDVSSQQGLRYRSDLQQLEGAICVCYKTIEPSRITEHEAEGYVHSALENENWTILESTFSDEGTKTLDFKAVASNVVGKFTVFGKIFFVPHCFFMPFGAAVNERDLPRAQSFIATAKPLISPDSPTPVGHGDTASRLKKLKELLDQGLITKDEYDSKRLAILGEM